MQAILKEAAEVKMEMDDFIWSVSVIVAGATIISVAKMIIKYLKARNKLCAWHRENVTMLMYIMDPILEFIKKESEKNGTPLNGRYTRARDYLDEFFAEDVKYRKEGKF